MSTISIQAGITFSCFIMLYKTLILLSGTLTVPIFGSIVQNGKFAHCALAFEKQLNKDDLPTLGKPTIPAFIINRGA